MNYKVMVTLVCAWLAFFLPSCDEASNEETIVVEKEEGKDVDRTFTVPIEYSAYNFLIVRFGGYEAGQPDPVPLQLRADDDDVTYLSSNLTLLFFGKLPGKNFSICMKNVKLHDSRKYLLQALMVDPSNNETSLKFRVIIELKVYKLNSSAIRKTYNKPNSTEGGKLENPEKNPRGKGENNTVVRGKHLTTTPPMSPTNNTSNHNVTILGTGNEGGDKSLSTTIIIIVTVVVIIVIIVIIVIVILCYCFHKGKRQNKKENLDELERLDFNDHAADAPVLGDNMVTDAL